MFDPEEYLKQQLDKKVNDWVDTHLVNDDEQMYITREHIAKKLDVSLSLLLKDRFFSREAVLDLEEPFSSRLRLFRYPEIEAEIERYRYEKGLKVKKEQLA